MSKKEGEKKAKTGLKVTTLDDIQDRPKTAMKTVLDRSAIEPPPHPHCNIKLVWAKNLLASDIDTGASDPVVFASIGDDPDKSIEEYLCQGKGNGENCKCGQKKVCSGGIFEVFTRDVLCVKCTSSKWDINSARRDDKLFMDNVLQSRCNSGSLDPDVGQSKQVLPATKDACRVGISSRIKGTLNPVWKGDEEPMLLSLSSSDELDLNHIAKSRVILLIRDEDYEEGSGLYFQDLGVIELLIADIIKDGKEIAKKNDKMDAIAWSSNDLPLLPTKYIPSSKKWLPGGIGHIKLKITLYAPREEGKPSIVSLLKEYFSDPKNYSDVIEWKKDPLAYRLKKEDEKRRQIEREERNIKKRMMEEEEALLKALTEEEQKRLADELQAQEEMLLAEMEKAQSTIEEDLVENQNESSEHIDPVIDGDQIEESISPTDAELENVVEGQETISSPNEGDAVRSDSAADLMPISGGPGRGDEVVSGGKPKPGDPSQKGKETPPAAKPVDASAVQEIQPSKEVIVNGKDVETNNTSTATKPEDSSNTAGDKGSSSSTTVAESKVQQEIPPVVVSNKPQPEVQRKQESDIEKSDPKDTKFVPSLPAETDDMMSSKTKPANTEKDSKGAVKHEVINAKPKGGKIIVQSSDDKVGKQPVVSASNGLDKAVADKYTVPRARSDYDTVKNLREMQQQREALQKQLEEFTKVASTVENVMKGLTQNLEKFGTAAVNSSTGTLALTVGADNSSTAKPAEKTSSRSKRKPLSSHIEAQRSKLSPRATSVDDSSVVVTQKRSKATVGNDNESVIDETPRDDGSMASDVSFRSAGMVAMAANYMSKPISKPVRPAMRVTDESDCLRPGEINWPKFKAVLKAGDDRQIRIAYSTILDVGDLNELSQLMEITGPKPEILTDTLRTKTYDSIAIMLSRDIETERCLVWILALVRGTEDSLVKIIARHTIRDLVDSLEVLGAEPSRRGLLASLLASQLDKTMNNSLKVSMRREFSRSGLH